MKKDVITFILVDDHPVVRDGMEAMLLSEEDFDSFGTAADADEAIALVRAKPPDVVLTDVRMPKGDGFQLLNALKAEFPKVFQVSTYLPPVLKKNFIGLANEIEILVRINIFNVRYFTDG